MTTLTGFGSVDELRRTLRAMGADGVRAVTSAVAAPTGWTAAGEQVVLVCGCGGSAGATTVAVALATVAGRARVIETCGAAASGLSHAASAELGATERGWLRGARDQVVVERRPDPIAAPDQLPVPAVTDLALTVIDSSWEIAAVLTSGGWLGDLARTAPTVVLVARATVPGLRRLEAALGAVGESRAVGVTVGAKRWPRPVAQSAGPAVRRLAVRDRIIRLPEVPTLAIAGLTPEPLPPALTRPASTLKTLLEGLRS